MQISVLLFSFFLVLPSLQVTPSSCLCSAMVWRRRNVLLALLALLGLLIIVRHPYFLCFTTMATTGIVWIVGALHLFDLFAIFWRLATCFTVWLLTMRSVRGKINGRIGAAALRPLHAVILIALIPVLLVALKWSGTSNALATFLAKWKRRWRSCGRVGWKTLLVLHGCTTILTSSWTGVKGCLVSSLKLSSGLKDAEFCLDGAMLKFSSYWQVIFLSFMSIFRLGGLFWSAATFLESWPHQCWYNTVTLY